MSDLCNFCIKIIDWSDKLKFSDLEIFFAYQSFKWTNNAKDKAGVTVVIIGVSNINIKKKDI